MSKPRAWYTGRVGCMGDRKLEPGFYLDVEVNQGDRHGVVLAVLGDEALIEYFMPRSQTTALWIVRRDPPYGRVRNQSYYSVPIKWLRALVEEDGIGWAGFPQQQGKVKGPVCTPEEYLRERTG